MVAIAITRLLTAAELGAASAKSRDTQAARRMLALALVLEGADRKTAAEACGMDRQTLRDWVHRYNAEGPAGLSNHRSAPRPRRLDPGQVSELMAWLETGPDPAPVPVGDGVVAGDGGTCNGGSRIGSGWICTSGRWANTWRRSATGGSRCARGTLRPIRRRRRLSKKLPRGGSRGDPRGRARQAARDLVPRRGPRRSAGHAHPGSGRSAARARGRRATPATSGPTSSARSARSAAWPRGLAMPFD